MKQLKWEARSMGVMGRVYGGHGPGFSILTHASTLGIGSCCAGVAGDATTPMPENVRLVVWFRAGGSQSSRDH
jgi:hypothetical protein